MPRTAEDCGRSATGDRLSAPLARDGLPLYFRSARRAEIACSGGLILGSKALTRPAPQDYIDPLGRAAAWRDGASAKPLTVYAVNHPAMSYGHVGCAGFGGSGACRRRGRKAPGCLKSESEERETWTAESLRAASRGEAILYWSGFGRDFGGSRLRYIADRKISGWTSSM